MLALPCLQLMPFSKGWQSVAPGPNSTSHLVWKQSFIGTLPRPVVYGSFYLTAIELCIVDHKARTMYSLALYRKSVLAHALPFPVEIEFSGLCSFQGFPRKGP